MRVYEYGHIKPMYAFCPGCGAILEFNKSDQRLSNIALHKGLQNDGKDWVIKCPVCMRAIYDCDFKESPDDC
jgi:hypothetical protein